MRSFSAFSTSSLSLSLSVASFLALTTLSTSASAGGPTWENLVTGDGVQGVPGLKGAVWVPNQFNNPTIDSAGNVIFRGQFAGAGISTANSRAIFRGTPGNWTMIAREGSPLPGGLVPGAVINTASGINGLSSANMVTADGGIVVAASINGGGVTSANNDVNVFVASNGAASMLAREGDAFPGASGVTMTVSQLSSGVYVNNAGKAITNVSLTGTGVITTAGVTQNNSAVVRYTTAGTEVVFRRGDAAPGAGVADQWAIPAGSVLQQDTFGLFENGEKIAFSGKLLHPVAGTVPLNADNVYLANVDGTLKVIARDGSEIPGFPGIIFKQSSDFVGPISWGNHPIMDDGTIIFNTIMGGAVTAGLDDVAIMQVKDGVYTVLARRGEVWPGVSDGLVFSGPNTNSFIRNQGGLLAFQGILMNADGTAAATNATFVGFRRADGSKGVICRQGDAVPGLKGVTFGSLNGSTSICISDAGTVVFNANLVGAEFPTGGAAIMAFDTVNGLRVLAKTNDTGFTGTPVNQITLIGGTGVNGNGGNTGINPSGYLVARFADTANAIYTIARINLDPGTAPCPADFDNDGEVGASDLATLLGAWGTNGADLDGDGDTGASDLAILLAAWGNCQ